MLLVPCVKAEGGAGSPHDSFAVVNVKFRDAADRLLIESLAAREYRENLGDCGFYIMREVQLSVLKEMGIPFERISEIKPTEPVSMTISEIDSLYHDYAEMVSILSAQAMNHPDIAMVESIGVSQQEQKTIYAMKISDDVGLDEDEPVIFFDGVHHACEVMGLEICLALIDTLLKGYGIDSAITHYVDNLEIWLVPLVNPDGHSAVMNEISLYYRKNGRDLNGNDTLYEFTCNYWWTCQTEGIDLNRNYDWYWDWGGQTSPWDYYYRGASAGSESENAAMVSILSRVKPILSLSYHSYGELIFYPWNFGEDQAPDHEAIYEIATGLAMRITREDNQGTYDVSAADGRVGLALNWQYGRLGAFSYSPETVRYPDFIVPAPRYNQVIRENLDGCFYLMQRAFGPQLTGRITAPNSNQPVSAEVRVLEVYSSVVDPRFSDSLYGRYRHLLLPGIYSVEVITDSFPRVRIDDIEVGVGSATVLDIHLPEFVPGDANGSGEISPADVTFLVRYLKGLGEPPVPLLSGDCNGDCLVRGTDVTYLVAFFKGTQRSPSYGNCR